MSSQIVLKSFADLAQLLDPAELAAEPAAETAASPDGEAAAAVPAIPIDADPPAEPVETESSLDVDALLAELESAGATLTRVARQDEEARTLARRDLETHDELAAPVDRAEQALARSREVRERAEALACGAFADETRAAAADVLARAAAAEARAARCMQERRAALEAFAASRDLERLLAERRRLEEAEKARAALAAKAERLSGALAGASEALRSGRFEEAKALLGPVANENPGNAEIDSLLEIIARRTLDVKIAAAEEALWAARRGYRHEPAEAVARLEALDVEGLPGPLASQLFGAWAQACGRLCRERGLVEPLRYAPDPGRAAVL